MIPWPSEGLSNNFKYLLSGQLEGQIKSRTDKAKSRTYVPSSELGLDDKPTFTISVGKPKEDPVKFENLLTADLEVGDSYQKIIN